MQYKHIQVIEYNPQWPKMFEDESKGIKDALKDNCIEVHHVGSTCSMLYLILLQNTQGVRAKQGTKTNLVFSTINVYNSRYYYA